MSEETLLEFPCKFPIKAMGRDTSEFRATVRALVEAQTGPVSDDAIQTALSRNGRFVSITITVDAQSQQQLDEVYRAITAHEDVLMAL